MYLELNSIFFLPKSIQIAFLFTIKFLIFFSLSNLFDHHFYFIVSQLYCSPLNVEPVGFICRTNFLLIWAIFCHLLFSSSSIELALLFFKRKEPTNKHFLFVSLSLISTPFFFSSEVFRLNWRRSLQRDVVFFYKL